MSAVEETREKNNQLFSIRDGGNEKQLGGTESFLGGESMKNYGSRDWGVGSDGRQGEGGQNKSPLKVSKRSARSRRPIDRK